MIWIRTILVLLFTLVIHTSDAQVVFQVERLEQASPEKYYNGYILEYKTAAFPKEWFKKRIIEIKDKEKMIVFENGYIYIDEITVIRKRRAYMNVVSKMLYGFGASWFLFGTIATLTGDYDPGLDTVAIGGLSLLGGWIFRQFYYAKTTINKRNRLRIIDLSWP